MYKSKGIPHPTKNRRDWIEKHLVGQRNREEAFRQTWDSTAKYFQTCQVKSDKYAHLSSPEIYQQSMDAYHQRMLKEEREKNYEVKIINSKIVTTDELGRVGNQNKARNNLERCPIRFDISEDAYYPCNLPDGDMKPKDESSPYVPSDRLQPFVKSTDRRCEKPLPIEEEQKQAVSSDPAGLHVTDIPQIRCNLEVPAQVTPQPAENILETVQNSERESSSLKLEHSELWNYLQRLRDKYAQRSVLLRNKQKLSWRNTGIRPYKIQIQLCGRHIIEALELDIQMLNLVQSIVKRIEKDSNLQEQMEQMKLNLIRDHKREKDRLWGVENLFQEEAERLWFVQSAEWEKEEKERDSVIEQCVKLAESKLQCRLSENLERQQSNIQSRESLLSRLH